MIQDEVLEAPPISELNWGIFSQFDVRSQTKRALIIFEQKYRAQKEQEPWTLSYIVHMDVFCLPSRSLLIWTFFIAAALKVIPYFDWI